MFLSPLDREVIGVERPAAATLMPRQTDWQTGNCRASVKDFRQQTARFLEVSSKSYSEIWLTPAFSTS